MAPADDDGSIEEKRVYAATAGRIDAYVATDVGIVRVAISGDRVGTFELVRRESARDVAVLDPAKSAGRSDRSNSVAMLGVVSDEGIHVAALPETESEVTFTSIDAPEMDATGSADTANADSAGADTTNADSAGADTTNADSAGADTTNADSAAVDTASDRFVAIGAHDEGFLVARANGELLWVRPRIEGRSDGSERASIETTVERIGRVEGPAAIDGPLIASDDGVFRVLETAGEYRIESVGLDAVRDVAGRGVPLAATSDGLYRLGNGWMVAREGPFDAVAADGDGRSTAVDADGTPFVRTEVTDGSDGWGPDAWTESPLPVDGRPAAVAVDQGLTIVVTESGTLCVDAGDGWRHRALGTPGVHGATLVTVDDG